MKLGWIFPLLLICGLLSVPGQTAAVASDAAVLWWTCVLPSLLPYLIAASLLERSGLLLRVPKRIVLPLLWLFGVLGGYPIGAKLARSLSRDGILIESDASKAAAYCNLPNPVFIISVIALGIFHSARAVLPLLIGVYGIALFGLFPLFRIRCFEGSFNEHRFSLDDLPSAIESGVHSILLIGGCMIFASVLGALSESVKISHILAKVFGAEEGTVHAGLLGLFEMTCGIRAVASLAIPFRMRLAICAGFVQFGGCSVLLQTASQGCISVPRYALTKLVFAVCSACLTYWIAPLFCTEMPVETFASRAEILQNGVSMLSVIFSASIGLFAVFTLTFGLSHRKKAP